MTDISKGVKYAPLFAHKQGVDDIQSAFCFDQAKRNLLHLVGEYTLDSIAGCPLASSIHTYMDKETRFQLQGLPLDFMRFWHSIDDGNTALLEHAPPLHLQIMQSRAEEAQKVVLGIVEDGNVIKVNFRRSA